MSQIKPNLNFNNQYYCCIVGENRERAIALLNKIQKERPEIYRNAGIEIRQEGIDMYIRIENMSVFEAESRLIILRWFNSIRTYK